MNWISSTTPPKKATPVLALNNGGYPHIAIYVPEQDRWYDGNCYVDLVVDWWMPIPEKPKE